jgi:hypothetical protein
MIITQSGIGKDVTENNHALFSGIMPIIIRKELRHCTKISAMAGGHHVEI